MSGYVSAAMKYERCGMAGYKMSGYVSAASKYEPFCKA